MIQAQELRRYDPLTSASSIDSGSRAASLRPFDFCFFHCDLLSLLFLFVALRRVRRYDSLEPLTQCRIKEKCVKLWVVSRRHRMDIGGIVRHACGRSFPSFMLRSMRLRARASFAPLRKHDMIWICFGAAGAAFQKRILICKGRWSLLLICTCQAYAKSNIKLHCTWRCAVSSALLQRSR